MDAVEVGCVDDTVGVTAERIGCAEFADKWDDFAAIVKVDCAPLTEQVNRFVPSSFSHGVSFPLFRCVSLFMPSFTLFFECLNPPDSHEHYIRRWYIF